jgi:hypothetical protein
MADPSTQETESTQEPDLERIEERIEEQRAELGDTAGAIAEKADVKRQAKLKLEETKAGVREKVDQLMESMNARKDALAESAREAAPDSTDGAGQQALGQQALEKARQNPAPFAAAVVAGLLILWVLKR